jgi:hypothetical protein
MGLVNVMRAVAAAIQPVNPDARDSPGGVGEGECGAPPAGPVPPAPDLGAYRFGPVTSRSDTAVCPIVH